VFQRSRGSVPRLVAAAIAVFSAAIALGSCGNRSATSVAAQPPPAQPQPPVPPALSGAANDSGASSAVVDGAVAPVAAGLPPMAAGSTPPSFAPIVRRVRPAVVSIFTARVEQRGMAWGFTNPGDRIQRGLGTGFLINADGEILTNEHVIANAQYIEVQLDDGRRYGADVLGRDSRVDIALLRLKVNGIPLTPASLGNSDAMDIGDWVMTIGNPFGLAQTVTVGIVSARGRTGRDVPLDPAGYYSFIQTDASINPGNSGGPLLNMRGEVIGINTAVNRSGQGIGFAIPINMVTTILPQLRRYGRVIRSWLGISIREVDDNVRTALTLPDNHGALVMDIDPAGPALSAGLLPGDVIRRFDTSTINNSSELSWLASTAGIGHRARLHVFRGGREMDLDIALAAMPDAPQAQMPPQGLPPGMAPPGMMPGLPPGMAPPGMMPGMPPNGILPPGIP